MKRKKVIIVGAGLAGISCAYELAAEGYDVIILEANKYAGGRTASWDYDGMLVESGLHRFLGFYKELPELIKNCEIEIDNVVEWLNEIIIKLPDGKPEAQYSISIKDEPLSTIKNILGQNDFLTIKDKTVLFKFFSFGIKDHVSNPQYLDTLSVYEYALEHKLSEKVIHRILTPLTEGIFFISPKRFSAFVFFSLIVPYIPNMHNLGEGAFKGGMSEIMINPMVNYLERNGVTIKKGVSVQSLLLKNATQINGVITKDQKMLSDNVVLAVDIGSAKSIIKKSFTDLNKFSNLFKLKTIPAVTVQIETKEPSIKNDLVHFSPGTMLASYAEQSRSTFKEKGGRLSIILNQPEKYMDIQPDRLLSNILLDMGRLNINISEIINYRVVSHKADFYSLAPESESLRPSQSTHVQGLTLAGDYTKQKYTATMEGAVYSGKLAAMNLITNG
jgi:15-cis-phytoene desaturase